MTASKLKHLSKCPETFQKKYLLEQIPEEQSNALDIGTAFDFFVSFGEKAFWKEYVILPFRKARDFTAYPYQLTNGEGKTILALMEAKKRQPFFDASGDYQEQAVLTSEYKGVPVSGTFDRVSMSRGIIRDTKTCDDEKYYYSIRNYDYIFSMAFYEWLYEMNTGKRAESVILDFFTKNKYQYIPVEISRDTLDEKRLEIFNTLDFYIECKKNNSFPSCQEWKKYDDAFLSCPCPEHCSGCVPKKAIMYSEVC